MKIICAILLLIVPAANLVGSLLKDIKKAPEDKASAITASILWFILTYACYYFGADYLYKFLHP